MAEDFRSQLPARSGHRLLALFIVLSVVVHALGLLLFPGQSVDTGRNPQVQALEVMLLKPETPPPVQQPSVPATKPAPVRSETARKPEVIALPKSAAPPAAVIEVPRVREPVAPPMPVSPIAVPRAPAVEAKAEKPSAEPVVAPSFNAAYLRNPAPRYPIIARRNGEQGTVMLKVLVTREGAPASVSVDKSSGSAHLDSAALETVRSWRFAPARQGAQQVEAWVLVPIVFRLEPVS